MAERRTAKALTAVSLAGALALGAVACSNDQAQDADTPDIQREIEPARGAADGVVDGTEDGKDLDENLNVPGTETDDEVDTAFDNEEEYEEDG